MGASDQAIAAGQRALALTTVSGEVVLQALANQSLRLAYRAQDDCRRAIDCFGRTVAFFENETGDCWVERILSVRGTCRLRGVPTFPVLVDAITCYVNGQHPDVSWI